jgi:Tfp pilus assembly protein PilO
MPMMDMFKGKVTLQDWIFVGVVLAVTVGLFVAFFFLVYTGKRVTIAARAEEYNKVSEELKAAQKIDANIDALQEEADKMNNLVSLFEKRLPERREIPSLLKGIETQAADFGLRVEMSTLPPRVEANIEVIPYKVVAIGKFHDVVTFINMLERDQRYFKISDIDIGEEENGVSQTQFVLSTFRFIQDEAGAK